jgi:hypothetical protein
MSAAAPDGAPPRRIGDKKLHTSRFFLGIELKSSLLKGRFLAQGKWVKKP